MTTGVSTHSPCYRFVIAAALLSLGLLLSHQQMLRSHLRLTPGDQFDAALINYTLEHDYRWLLQEAPHKSFWNSPIFYPEPNTAAYTDLLLGTIPFYAPWRAAGLLPETSLQMWLLTVCVLNFGSFYLFLRRLAGLREVAAAAGAFLFAFGSSRIVQEWHLQLVPAFYVVASVAGLWLMFEQRRVIVGLSLFIGGLIAQLYTAFYYSWFLVFAYSMAAVYSLVRREYRKDVLEFIGKNWRHVILCGLVAFLLALPFIWHSLLAMWATGPPWPYPLELLPGIMSWFRQGSQSWLYGWLDAYLRLPQNPQFYEESNGVGVFTLLLVISGFWLGRRRRPIALIGLVALILICLSLRLPDGFSLWKIVYNLFPGAKAIRAVGRIGLFLLFAASLAVAYAIHNIRSVPTVAVCLVLIVLEQGVNAHLYNKQGFRREVAQVSHKLDAGCAAFLFSPNWWSPYYAHTVAMHATWEAGIPTINGISGRYAPGWAFADPRIMTDADCSRLREALRLWFARHPDLSDVCWIQSEGNDFRVVRLRDNQVVPASPTGTCY